MTTGTIFFVGIGVSLLVAVYVALLVIAARGDAERRRT
jgi:hypothetical protein